MSTAAILIITMTVGLFIAAALDEAAMCARVWWERRR